MRAQCVSQQNVLTFNRSIPNFLGEELTLACKVEDKRIKFPLKFVHFDPIFYFMYKQVVIKTTDGAPCFLFDGF